MVSNIFRLYSEGKAITDIVKILNAKGLRTLRGHAFTHNSLRTVLKKEHFVFFLYQFSGMDYSDIDCQKRLIRTFPNSGFVYDDKVILTFNYSGNDRTITLHEIVGRLGHSICIPSAVVYQMKNPDAYASGFFVSWALWESKNHMQAATGWTAATP